MRRTGTAVREVLREVVDVSPVLARRLVASRLGRGTTSGVAALVLDAGGHLLLVRVSYRRGWALPGGFLDTGEDPAAGVVRELAEETGLRAETPLTALRVVDGPGRNHRTHVFGAELTAAGPRLAAPRPWEVRGIGWFGPDGLPPLHPIGAALVETAGGLLVRTPEGRFAFA